MTTATNLHLVRVGVVGTSWWADLEHLPGLRARGDVSLAALCGRNPARLAELAARHGVERTFTDWREAIAAGGLDALVVAAPNALHHPIAAAALDAGLHVLCEKPLAMDLAQARDLAARAAAARLATLTFFTHRTIGAAAHAARLLREGAVGRPLHVHATYLTGSDLRPGKPLAWRMRRAEAGTGALGDIGSHLVDLVRWWVGDIERVVAQWQTAHRERAGGEADADEACAFLARLAGGVQAVFQASKLAAGRVNQQRIEVAGDAGALVYEADPGADPTWEGRVLLGRVDRPGLEPLPLPPDLARGLAGVDARAGRDEGYRRLTDPFFAAVRGGGGEVHPDFRDGAAVQAVLDGVARSADTGAWVDVERV
jgi:predicted dehydrogenase